MVAEEKKTKRTVMILHQIAVDGPLNKYRICRNLRKRGGSEPTLLYAVNDLEERGFIEVHHTIKKVRGTGPSKYYELSIFGLAALIAYNDLRNAEARAALFNRLAVKYHDLLPDIFDLWPSVVEVGMERIGGQRLVKAADRILEFHRFRDRKLKALADPVLLAGIVTGTFLSVRDRYFVVPPWDDEEWIMAIRGNEKLREATIREEMGKALAELGSVNHTLHDLGAAEIQVTRESWKSLAQKLGSAEPPRFLNELKEAVGTHFG